MSTSSICKASDNKKSCIICPKGGPLVDLKRHCHNIVRFYSSESHHVEGLIPDWFQIASGITEVSYSSDLYDPTVYYCETAMEYENKKSEYHSKLIREITRFNFIWSGLEALINSLELPLCPDGRNGKIKKVNFFFKENYENKLPILKYYLEIMDFFKIILTENASYGKVNELFSPEKYISDKLIGLKIVYKIRNAFAHGVFQFNEPPGWTSERPYDSHIILTSSRIVLLTIQMLLLATHKNLNFNVGELHESPENGEGVNAEEFLLNMHIENFEYC